MITTYGEWIHLTRSYEEWWFRKSDVAAIQAKGKDGKPTAFPDQYDPWVCALYIKGISAAGDFQGSILLSERELDAIKEIIGITCNEKQNPVP